MNFQSFIEKHYLTESANNLMALLNELQLIEPITFFVDDYYNNTKQNTIEATIVQLSFTIYNFTETVNICLSKLKEKKQEITTHLAELGIRLIKETYKASNLPKDTYFNTLKSTLQKLYLKQNWNFEQLEEILNLNRLHQFEIQQKEAQKETQLAIRKKIYFEWNHNKFPQENFFDDVEETFKLNKRKSNFSLLFDAVKTDFSIAIHSTKLESFLILMQHLYNENILVAKGNKGYFTYLAKHITSTKNDTHPKREFKKICSDCLQNEVKKKQVENNISYMLKKYSNKAL